MSKTPELNYEPAVRIPSYEQSPSTPKLELMDNGNFILNTPCQK